MPKEHHFKWEWDFRSSPEAIWPYIADTNRFNQDAGIPDVKRVAGAAAAGDGTRLQMSVNGMTLEWDEAPFEWTAPSRFGVVRKYHRGPMEEIRVDAELTPRDGGGSHLVYQIWMTPRGLLGRLIPIRMKWKSHAEFDAVFRRYDEFAQAGKPALVPPAKVELVSGGRERLAQIRQGLLDFGRDEALVERLIGLIETADDLTLARLRPFVLAEQWAAPRRKVLELCLYGVRGGLLDFRWDMLCPLCRGAKAVAETLGGLRREVHCDSCNIDFEVNFERSVELTFRPNASIRRIEVEEFCVGGPRVTPHIAVQQLLPPGANRTIQPALEPGTYRARTKNTAGAQHLRVEAGGGAEATIRARTEGWPIDEPRVAPRPTLHLENLTDRPQTFILERTVWSDLAVTAAEVTGMQVFRDLFAKEALRPGEQISVGSMCVLFTDLLDSTRLYREIGDAKAFGLVMEHFDVLRKTVAEAEGALVKTIGDAVLAVFRTPAPALKAILRAGQELAKEKPGRKPLFLKAGLHFGPCIAVTLNERLDYFGSTVNIAARLVGLCSGGDVVISSEVKGDPEVSGYLEACGYKLEDIKAALKGFDAMKFDLVRIVPSWAAPKAEDGGKGKTQRF
ncbi:MAG: adenylate/guanylate cyclase domain-containing protein [Planctomycetes bacterium]|nr:adenylate/guanylate cyclase domain-containing protein [Planctomycetota bacterium]